MNNPIGIFDSGVGGLSVWIELQKKLPNEDFVYYADSNNCPYGDKTDQEIIDLSIRITQFLIQKHCKLIIVACNTATAAAIQILRKTFRIPFIGMEPAIKPAAQTTKSGVIGILATQGTFKGNHYKETSAKYANNIEAITQPGIGLVELVENNNTDTPEAKEILLKYVRPMLEKGVDKIVLGCTHYPFLINTLKQIIPSGIEIINPAPAIASRTYQILKDEDLLTQEVNVGSSVFYSSGNSDVLQQMIDKHSTKKINVENILL